MRASCIGSVESSCALRWGTTRMRALTNALLPAVVTQWKNVLPPSTNVIGLVATSATGGGLGYVGAVGNPGFSANGATREGDFSIVWRHEVGHNWSLGHYDGGTPEGRTINSGNRLARLSGPEEAKVIAHRNARSNFLDKVGAYPFSIPPCASLDRATYLPQDTAIRIDVLDNDHDANGDALRISGFDFATALGGHVRRSAGTGIGGRDELLYTPPAIRSALTDHFAYRIADATGREAKGNVVTRLGSDAVLLAHYSMNANSGTVALDSSEYRRDATLENGASWTPGVIGGAIVFDGIDDELIADAPQVATDRFTVTGLIRRYGSQAANAGIVFARGGQMRACGFNFGDHNELRYHWNGDNWNWDSGLIVPDNTWTFVALTISPQGATLYMDSGSGLRSATRSGNHGAEPLDAALHIGRDPNSVSRSFRGAMDDIRIYSSTLGPKEIAVAATRLGSAADPNPPQLESRLTSQVHLIWNPSPKTVQSRVFFSADYRSVRDGRAEADRGTTTASLWTTPLLGNQSYYWRVDASDGTNWVAGPVWSFQVVAGATFAFTQNYGVGCSGSQNLVPKCSAAGLPRLGSQSFAIEVERARAQTAAALLIGADSADLAISGCSLLVRTPWISLPAIVTDLQGRGALPLPIGQDSALLGIRIFGQYLVLDTGAQLFGLASVSEGIHVAIGY
ncbi:MAG: hypothetical protein H6832_02525 [Planctomycetes bacterium]|nr:hypothetical protein [Planctomycetota bacterium]MCB9917260.1 hypothetical protein [Planctomycetota bacterium]